MLAPRLVPSGTRPVHLTSSAHHPSVQSSDLVRDTIAPRSGAARVEAGSTGGPGRGPKPLRLSKQLRGKQDCVAQINHVLVGQRLFAR